MRLEGGLVLVDLVEVVDVLVLPVLEHVEAQAAALVLLRGERVVLDGLEKALPLRRFDTPLHPDREHRVSLQLVRRRRRACAGPRRSPAARPRDREMRGRPCHTSSARCPDRPRGCARCRGATPPAGISRPGRSRGLSATPPPPETPAPSRVPWEGLYHREVFSHPVTLVLEVTGRPEVLNDLLRTRPPGVEVIGAGSLRFFWDLLQDRRESDDRMRAILETALDCVITMDHAGIIVEFNP